MGTPQTEALTIAPPAACLPQECAHHEAHSRVGRATKFLYFICGSAVIALTNLVPEGHGHDH